MFRLLQTTASRIRAAALVLLGPALFMDTTAITIVLAFAAGAWLVEGNWRHNRRPAARPAVFIGIGLWVLLAASISWSFLPAGEAWLFSKKYIELLLLGVCVTLFHTSRERDFAAASFVIAGAVYGIILCAVLALAEPNTPVWDHFISYRITGGMCLAYAAALSLRARSPAPLHITPLLRISGIISILALVFQGGLTALLVIMVMGLFLVKQADPALRRKLLSAMAAVVLLTILLPTPRQRVTETWQAGRQALHTARPEQAYSSPAARLYLARDALQMTAQKPFLGHGLGTFEPLHQQLLKQEGTDLKDWWAPHPHNEYLALSVQAGPPAAVLFILLLVSLYRAGKGLPMPNRYILQITVIGFAASCLLNAHIQEWEEGALFLFLVALGFSPTDAD